MIVKVVSKGGDAEPDGDEVGGDGAGGETAMLVDDVGVFAFGFLLDMVGRQIEVGIVGYHGIIAPRRMKSSVV
jgi:hypothetical protein